MNKPEHTPSEAYIERQENDSKKPTLIRRIGEFALKSSSAVKKIFSKEKQKKTSNSEALATFDQEAKDRTAIIHQTNTDLAMITEYTQGKELASECGDIVYANEVSKDTLTFGIIDGGGSSSDNGRHAAYIAVDELKNTEKTFDDSLLFSHIDTALSQLNTKIQTRSRNDIDPDNSSFAAASVGVIKRMPYGELRASILHSGDTAVYHIKHNTGEIVRRTKGENIGNILYNYIGKGYDGEVHSGGIVSFAMEEGDKVFCCTDGIDERKNTDGRIVPTDPKDIEKILRNKSTKEAFDEILEQSTKPDDKGMLLIETKANQSREKKSSTKRKVIAGIGALLAGSALLVGAHTLSTNRTNDQIETSPTPSISETTPATSKSSTRIEANIPDTTNTDPVAKSAERIELATSEAAIVSKGEGWYQTLTEFGITDRSQQDAFLEENRDVLIASGSAYPMSDGTLGLRRGNGTLPKEVVVFLQPNAKQSATVSTSK